MLKKILLCAMLVIIANNLSFCGEDSSLNNKYYSVTDCIKCGDTDILSIITRINNSSEDYGFSGYANSIYFIDNKTNRSILVRDSSDWDRFNDKNKNRISSPIMQTSWSCYSNGSSNYVIVLYSTGGKVPCSEFEELYDMNGNLLGSNFIHPDRCENFADYSALCDKYSKLLYRKINKLGIVYKYEDLVDIKTQLNQ